MLTLPDSLRARLREPFGPVLSGEEAVKRLADRAVVAAVGDITTLTLLEADVTPRLMVVDHVTKRTDAAPAALRERLADDRFNIVNVENPAATVTDALWEAVARAYGATGHTVIEVEGEEDLATLPAILLAPDGAAVAYGQPDEGMVVVEVDNDARDAVKGILGRMERK